MNSYTLYILKVCLGISIFAIAYYFFLRKDTALQLKRFFLLGGLFIAFLIPLLAIKSPEIIEYSALDFEAGQLQIVPDEALIASEIPEASPINWPTVLIALYFCGALILLFRNVFLILKWNNIWKNATRKEQGVAWSANDEIIAVFSRIFLPDSLKDSEEINSILLHEKAHVSQKHFIDLVFMELVMLVTWFNPFTWLFARMLKENHEHLADREALVGGADPTQYRVQLLNQTMGAQVFSLSQQFNNSFITNRFEMMKKSPSIRSGIIKTAILIPAILISLGFAVGKTKHSNTISGKVVFADTGEPANGASVIIKNSTTGTVSGNQGEYMLDLKDRAEVVFSFVGYKSQVHWFAPGEYRLVALEREVIPLSEPESPEIEVSQSRANGGSGRPHVSSAEGKDSIDDEVFFIVEEMPTFNGGDPSIEFRKFIMQNLQYPLGAAQKGISGRVIVQFVVSPEGMVIKPKVVVPVDPALDEEAIRVVSASTPWTPGKQRGKEVAVMYTFPINFILDQKTTETTTPQANPADSARNENKPEHEEVVFFVVEEMPKFNGGEPSQEFRKYINSNLVYPESWKIKKTNSRTIVEFTVSETGKVTNVKVIGPSGEAFDKEAIRVIEASPLWTPGKQRGKAVSVKYTYPVNFIFE